MDIKQHVKDHRDLYIGLAVGLAVGGICLNNKSINTGIQGMFVWKPHNVTETVLTPRVHPGYIVRARDTGEVFASKRRAAQVLGVSRENLETVADVIGVM